MHGHPLRTTETFRRALWGLGAALLAFATTGGEALAAANPFVETRRILTGGNLTAKDRATLDHVYNKIVLPSMTRVGNGDQLPTVRIKGYKSLIRGVPKNQALDYVNQLMLNGLRHIVGGPYPPAVKYNALLTIGDLNESDEPNNVKPLPAALPLLMAALRVQDNMDYLRPAALVGLQRFVRENAVPRDQMGAVAGAMLAMVKEKDPPAGRSASVHNFIRRRAAEVLAAYGSPGPNNVVLDAFVDLATDPQADLMLRCSMAQLIGELKYPAGSKIDVQKLANMLTEQLVENCQQEIDKAEAAKRAPSRRVLLYALDSTYEGLKGLSGSPAAGNSEAYVRKLYNKIYSAYRALDDAEKTPDDDLVTAISTELSDLEGLVEAPAGGGGLAARPN